MEKIVMTVDEFADILKHVRELSNGTIGSEYCDVCREVNSGCPVASDCDCPHDKIVEYRFYVRHHYKQYIVKDYNMPENKWFTSPDMVNQFYQSEFAKALSSASVQVALAMLNTLKNVGTEHIKEELHSEN